MLQGERSAIPSTFIKLLFVIKIFALSIIEWSFYTGFTIHVGKDPDKQPLDSMLIEKICHTHKWINNISCLNVKISAKSAKLMELFTDNHAITF